MNEKTVVLGIAGGTASGKTTLIKRIKAMFGDDVTVISHDSYYKQHDEMTYEERCKINYDHPNAFDTDMMVADIRKLMMGLSIEKPIYDFTVHNRAKETEVVYPKKVIIVEGILIFENVEVRNLCDIKVFVDCDSDVRIVRRILRDTNERARSLESIINQYMTTVKPMHDEFVEPSKRYADLIIPSGGMNDPAFDVLTKWISSLI